jgi:putative SOS response-associated peptidase YedK
MTTEANQLVGGIHDRMPVILHDNDYDLWLDPEMQDPTKLKRLYKPFPATEMESYLVYPKSIMLAKKGPNSSNRWPGRKICFDLRARHF